MKIELTPIDGLLLIHPRVFEDDRGYFFESFSQKLFDEATCGSYTFVQDNESRSSRNVLRGLHFQIPPYEQGKLVRVIQGKVQDVAVDLRKNSPTYGRYYSAVLSAENKVQMFIPPGFAHGFAVLEEDTVFSYKCTNYYHRDSERSIYYGDKDLGIQWMVKDIILSEKDRKAAALKNFQNPF